MVLDLILFKFLSIIPVSVLRSVGYSKIGSKLVMYLKKRNESIKKPYDIGYGIKIYSDFTNPRELNLILGKDREKSIKEIFLKAIEENFSSGDFIIDCGANIGEFSLLAAKKIGQKGQVISIEPSKKIAEKLKDNFLLNGLKNFEVLEIAVSNQKYKTKLYEHGVSELSSLDPNLLEKPATSTAEINVDTLDNIIQSKNIKNVTMMKMDIDGFEHEALLGCKKSFLENRIKNLMCEVHYSLLNKKGLNENIIYDFLKENGFIIKIINKDEVGKTFHILASKVRK